MQRLHWTIQMTCYQEKARPGYHWVDLFVSVVISLYLLSTPVRAQESGLMNTERPSQNLSASIVGKGLVQIEIGWRSAEEESRVGKLNDSIFPEMLVRFGLTRWIEVRTGYTGKMISDFKFESSTQHEEQRGDMYLGIKWVLLKQRKVLPIIALHTGGIISLKSDRSAFGGEETGPQLGLLFQHKISNRSMLRYNLAADWYNVVMVGGKKDYRINYMYSICFEFSPVKWMTTFAEYFGIEPGLDHDPDSRHLAIGCKFRILDNLQLDAAYGIKRGSWADGDFFRIGVSARIPR